MSASRTTAARGAAARTGPWADPRWREWYEGHSSDVYSYIRFHIDSPETAEDLAAETFLRAFRAADRFDPERATAHTWILAIARNVVRDHLRRVRRHRQIPLGRVDDLVSDAPSPEDRLLREEEVRRMLRAMRGLRRRDRDMLSLRYGAGLASAEIGAVLGLSATAVRTRLWRALERLRAALETR